MTNMESFENLEIPFQVIRYHTKNVTNAYAFKEQFKRNGEEGFVRLALRLYF